MLASKITSKGQVTIPNELRKLLGVSAGDKIAFSANPDGVVTVRKFEKKQSLAGVLADKISKTASDADIDAAIQAGWQRSASD